MTILGVQRRAKNIGSASNEAKRISHATSPAATSTTRLYGPVARLGRHSVVTYCRKLGLGVRIQAMSGHNRPRPDRVHGYESTGHPSQASRHGQYKDDDPGTHIGLL